MINRPVKSGASNDTARGDKDVALAKESLQQLLTDSRVPDSVRKTLKKEYEQLADMLNRLDKQQLHIVVFGRVSAGKSSLLNALIGQPLFSVSVLHGETMEARATPWQEREVDGVFLVDTPGINEADGEEREQHAREVAQSADLVLYVADGDLTEVEMQALRLLVSAARPVVLVINKRDQYTLQQQVELKKSIVDKTRGLIDQKNIIFSAASPSDQTIIMVDDSGNEAEKQRSRPPDIDELKVRLWEIIENEGQTLAALNASLFASDISVQLGEKILAARQQLGQETIRLYCIAKGIAVALNPIPVADLLAAAAIDVSMIVHLSRVYGLPLTRREAGKLIRSIAGQMLALYSTFWAIHFASSALKISSAGLSTVATGIAQGGVAWYSTLVVGEAAEAYLAGGKSWGNAGPKLVVRNILDQLDRDSIINNARLEIKRMLQA